MKVLTEVVVFFLFAAFIIIGDFILLIRWLKCIKIKECHNKECHFRCERYSDKFTPEDYERIQKLISEL